MRLKRYRIIYQVLFDIDADKIGFATHVKTPNGVGLAGGSTMLRRSLPLKRVQAGERVDVEFEFSCCAAQGVYFCNVGVVGIVGEEQFFLHRIQDAIAFRVLPDADVIELGPADFDFVPTIRPRGSSGAD
jgi:lipopolysaccharide transport system ATP-binding protein